MKRTFAFRFVALSMLYLMIGSAAFADVRLPGFMGDHMVLQQEKPIRIWGWADQGESVEVSLAGKSAIATADQNGRWHVELPAMKADKQPHTMTVKGQNTIVVNDILVGEVWLCSGQSNMEWTVRSSVNSSEEIAAANYPLIRHIKIPRVPSTEPIDDLTAPWQVCSPDTAGDFTACGYFMARELFQDLDVPVGLINSSWGGTRVEPWTPPIGFEQVDALRGIYDSVVLKTPSSKPYHDRLASHIDATKKWIETASQSLAENQRVAANPPFPAELAPFQSHQDPTMLYNGMIHALVGFPIRGAIWYQGESNHGEGMLYFEKKKALIGGWRKLWDQGDFPFYYVQIAPFQYGNEDGTILARFWEAQAAVQQIPNTAMVVINDIATLGDIHPPNKQDVGHRLALLALKHDYGRDDVVAHSPEMDSLEVSDDALKITFRNTGGGLKSRDSKPISHFEVIGVGSDGYKPAKAVIDGDSVILTSTEVAKPVAFRFAWDKLAEPNLMGGTGLPVGAFRGGEEPDFLSTLPINREFQLVYDLDLKDLGADIHYAVDNSNDIGEFDRIGYLLELGNGTDPDQKLFVTMKAFTQDIKQIGIPTVSSKARFQTLVQDMDVFTTVGSLTAGKGITTGNIEFWPDNYGPQNAAAVKNASSALYDFGDQPSAPTAGYGSMQVHDYGARQTIFAINHWSAGGGADIGIGNSPGEQKDWTFSGNAGTYSSKRLRVFVKSRSAQ
ncbi:MAG: 9-O-acetylesterase [Planctomycetales bacterium]|nr:9-O-acetylesterase [Planctomycetales bacterium]